MLEHLDPLALEAQSSPFMQAGMVDLDGSFLFMLGLFVVFTGLLSVLVVKPLMASQQQRFANMDGARRDASSLSLEAAETRVAYESKVGDARHDAVMLRDSVRDDATSSANALIAAARKTNDAHIAERQAALNAAAEKARAEMDGMAQQLASALADKLMAAPPSPKRGA